jgi:hypothetical protein
MRVLLLDFDGVLNGTTKGPAFQWVPVLAQLLEPHADVRLVIHASARHHSDADFLARRLGVLTPRVLGVTEPRLPRWESIKAWLAGHPQVSSHRILDDMPAEFPVNLTELIVCPSNEGVTAATVQAQLQDWLAASAAPQPNNE